MKRFLCLFLAIIILILSGCVSEIDEVTVETPPQETYKPDNNTFGVAFSSGSSADPYTSSSELNTELMGLICEPLFSLSRSFGAEPVLCDSYTYSDRTYVFTLKDGVTFSDGSALRASDVEYSLNCAKQSGSYFASRLSIIESIRSSNKKKTVTVKLRYDNARFPALLDIPVIKEGTRGDMLPLGTGIYAPKEDLSSLVARQNHHSGKTPLYSAISLYDVSSSDELVFEFDSHNISILTGDPTGTTPLMPLSVAAQTPVPTTLMHYIGFNFRNADLANPEIRRLISYAINRTAAAESDFALMGNATTLPIHPEHASYPIETATKLDYSNKKSFSVSAPLTILVNSENAGKKAVCNRIAAELTQLGVPTTVRELPFSEYASALSRGDFSLYYAEVSIGADFDITSLISGPLNYGAISDPALLSAHAAYLAGDEAFGEYFEYFANSVPFAPIMFKNTVMYTQMNFFEKASPTSQNIYHDFCDWVLGG